MHLNEDFVIVEPVDGQGRPVPPGIPSAKIYLTNPFNYTLPLIRYEITDEVTVLDEPCPCGSALRRIADVQGRLDDFFYYPSGPTIYPIVFRSPLGRDANVVEYQVRQTARGANVAIRCAGAVDILGLRTEIAHGLSEQGLADPVVEVSVADGFERTVAGKLKRFIALG